MPARHRFKFTVIGRYRAHLKENEPAVTVTMAAGPDDHLTYAGTLTLSEAEWDTFVGGLEKGLNGAVVIDDQGASSPREIAAKI